MRPEARQQSPTRATGLTRHGIIELGRTTFDPSADPQSLKTAKLAFDSTLKRIPTWPLINALLSLIRPGEIEAWLRDGLTTELALLPLRPDGVRATLEVIFATCQTELPQPLPSGKPDRRGASISRDAIARAAKLLCKVPKATTPEAWFASLGPQLLSILDGHEGTELTVVAQQLICHILNIKTLGTPGSCGWVALVDPIISAVKPTPAAAQGSAQLKDLQSSDGVIDVTSRHVLVTASDLSLALRRLSTLLLSSPFPALCRRILSGILPQLWALCCWPEPSSRLQDQYCAPAKSLLETYLKIITVTTPVISLIHNLMCTGSSLDKTPKWQFQASQNGDINAVLLALPPPIIGDFLMHRAEVLARLLISSCSHADLSSVFSLLLERWIHKNCDPRYQPTHNTPVLLPSLPDSNPPDLEPIFEEVVMREMMQKSPETWIAKSGQLEALICQLLAAEESSDVCLGTDIVCITLSLLNLLITDPAFDKAKLKSDSLRQIESSLQQLSLSDSDEICVSARNIALLLKYRDDVQELEAPALQLSDQQLEDRRTYRLALSYVTQMDAPPPVRSEGLNLLSGLILARSPVLDVPAVLVLLSTVIQEDDDFLNLRIIKLYTQVAGQHPRTTIDDLLGHYVDARERYQLDVRLRFGEALLQVVDRLGETFTGEIAKNVTEAMLATAGRRGHRPKTQARQARLLRKSAMKNDEAEEAWDDETTDRPDDMAEAEKDDYDVLTSVVQGWESQRGAEDVRIRTSALSIVSAAIETNVSGVGAALTSEAVDLCIGVLSLERKPETAILRRAAILLVLSFVRALDQARQSKRRLGFGLTDLSRQDILRILRYLAPTDNDGLVREHALAVIESLDNWSLASLVEQEPPELLGMSRLAGLSVHLGATGNRPRIEEIE